jgi:hypothetical protein
MGNSWSNTFQSVIVLPTGATSGQRLVIDGTSDTITGYDAGNNVVLRISPASGFQDIQGTTFAQLANGILFLANTSAYTNPASLFIGSDGLNVVGPNTTGGTADAPPRLILTPGDNGGTVNAVAQIGVTTSATTTDLYVNGPIINGLQAFPATWQTPSYAANWAGSTTFNATAGFQTLQFRLDAEDNVWLYGCFQFNAGAGTDIFTLPAGYRPLVNRAQVPVDFFDTSAAAVDGRFLQVLTTGAVSIGGGGGANILGTVAAAGDQFFLNGKFPLGNIA